MKRNSLSKPEFDLSARPSCQLGQLITDGHKAYLEAVEGAVGTDVDYAMLMKLYGEATGQRAMSASIPPPSCTGARKVKIEGEPDMKAVSTSHVERQDLTMHMGMRRFTRLTNGFSKKIENYLHVLPLHFVHYNFCRCTRAFACHPRWRRA